VPNSFGDRTYDEAGDLYFEFIQHGLAQRGSMVHLAVDSVLRLLGDVKGRAVCDVACGEGHLSRTLVSRGALVTGIDLSASLIAYAQRQSQGADITYVIGDAQTLSPLPDAAFDGAVFHIALMDIPDFMAVFRSVWRILRAGGRFVFAILHPCFETPYHGPDSHLALDEAGNFVGFVVRAYTSEGHWNSGGTGMRGMFGAYHRMLSTYLNGLLDAGFVIERIDEPKLPPGNYTELSQQINSRGTQILVVSAIKTGGGALSLA